MNPNAEVKYPVSINLLKLLRRLDIIILQHQVRPRLANFQSSHSGHNNSITSEVAKKTGNARISTEFAKACQYLLLSFNKISTKKKNLCFKKFWLNDKFWRNDKFWLFLIKTLSSGSWYQREIWFMNVSKTSKRQNNLDVTDHCLPSHEH